MVSVIIPYNKDRGYLDKAIQSIKDQTYQDIEIIRSQSDNTAGYNFNKGLYKSKGDYICFLAEDDLLPSNSIQDRVEFMKSNDCDFIHSRALEMYSNGVKRDYRLTNPDVTFKSCLQSNGIMGGSVMYRRDCFDVLRFNEELPTAEEWEFNLRLLSNNKKLLFLDKITYIYRRHSEQKSIGNLAKEYQDKRQQTKDLIKSWYEHL